MAKRSTAALANKARGSEPAPPLAKGGPNTPTLTREELARQKALTAADIVAPLPENAQKPVAANDDGLPILLGYQARWVADASPVKIAQKSRRIGLTWAEAFDCVTIAAARRSAGGMNCYYIGYNFEMAREFIAACAMWAKHVHGAAVTGGEFIFRDVDAAGDTTEIRAYRITLASGFSIVALPSKPRSLRGMQGVVILDEAAFHDDLGEMLKAAMAMLMWGGKVRIISTHDGSGNPFNELVQDCLAKRKPYKVHTITFDDALKDGLYKRICTSSGKQWSDKAQAEWRASIVAFYAPNEGEELFCIPAEGSGAYFTLAMLLGAANDNVPVLLYQQKPEFTHLSDEARRKATQHWIDTELKPALARLDPSLPSAIGGDFARSGDISARFVYQTDKAGRRRCGLVLELRGIPFTDQEQIEAALIMGVPRFQAAKYDRTGNGAFLAERMQQRFGVERVEGVAFNANWYIENFPKYRSAIEDRTADLPKDDPIFADFRLVTLISGVPKVPENKRERVKGARPGQRHGDVAIAAVLAFAASAAVTWTSSGYEGAGNDTRHLEPRAERSGRMKMRADDDGDDDDDLPPEAASTW